MLKELKPWVKKHFFCISNLLKIDIKENNYLYLSQDKFKLYISIIMSGEGLEVSLIIKSKKQN